MREIWEGMRVLSAYNMGVARGSDIVKDLRSEDKDLMSAGHGQ